MSVKKVAEGMKGGASLVQALRDAGYHHFAAAIEAGQPPAPTPAPATTSPMPQPPKAAPRHTEVTPDYGLDVRSDADRLDEETRKEGNLEKKKALEARRQAAVNAGGKEPTDDDASDQVPRGQ